MTAQPAPAPASRSPRRVRLRAIAAFALGAALLAGCATGQRAQTAVATPVIDGVEGSIGSIDLRLVTIATPSGSYPVGSSARVELFIVNNGAADTLLSVSSGSAKSASLFKSAATEFTVTPTTAAAVPSVSATPTASASATGSSTASGSASSSPAATTSSASTSAAPSSSAAPSTSAAAAPVTIDLPSGETTPIGIKSSDPQILLSGLTTALYPAMSIPITFSFASAGTVTLQVSVHLSTAAVSAPTLATSHEESAS